MSEDIDSDDDGEFGLVPPSLIRLLKNILNQYPDNDQIIKEIIQNAEDAGASVVRFLYDENDKKTLFSLGKRELEGPALYSYNDAYFNEKDWKGIQMLGESLKEKDPIKVGKFGLGFKSVFHLTDNPIIMSAQKIGIINPDEKIFSDVSRKRTGKFLNFGEQPSLLAHHKDESDCFKNVLRVDSKNGICKGTVFRFGLRKHPSKLSETVYSKERMKDLLDKFKVDGHLALVFLKNIEKIEFYTRKSGESRASLIYSFSSKRMKQQEELEREREKNFMKDVAADYSRDSSTGFFVTKHLMIESNITNILREQHYEKKQYVVLNYYAGDLLEQEHELTTKQQAKEYGFIPLVGVAYGLSKSHSSTGHTFCALPLPILQKRTTGLPVHVNGYFALGPDRKDLKWPSDSETRSNDKDVSWNLFLIRRVLPEAYAKLFLYLRNQKYSAIDVYNALPDMKMVDDKWKAIGKEVLSKVFKERFLWTESREEWVSINDALFKDMTKNGYEAAYNFLHRCSVNVVSVPKHIDEQLKKIRTKKYDPKLVIHEVVKDNGVNLQNLPDEERIDLLDYMVQDPKDIVSLCNVPVLPLENGKFASPLRSFKEKLFFPNEKHLKTLVPGCESRLIKSELHQTTLLGKLRSIADAELCQVKILNQHDVASLLKTIFPPGYTASRELLSRFDMLTVSQSWFPIIWDYINKHDVLDKFTDLPLIPIREYKHFKGARMIRENSLLIYSSSTMKCPVLSLLEKLGCIIMNDLPPYIMNSSVFRLKYVHEYKDENIPVLLLNLQTKFGNCELVRRFTAIDDDSGKMKLFDTLCAMKRDRSDTRRKLLLLLKTLPINQNTKHVKLISINQCNKVAPLDLPDTYGNTSVYTTLIKCRSEHQRLFLEEIGAKALSRIDVIEKILLPAIETKSPLDPNDDKMIKYILTAIDGEDRGKYQVAKILERLKNVKFVPSDDGERHKPGNLFDYFDYRLRALFEGEKGKFPLTKSEKDLATLKLLGLKKEADVSSDDIIGCVDTLCLMKDVKKKEQKCLCILAHLERNIFLLNNRRLVTYLQDKEWIPISKDRPDSYPKRLSWFPERNKDSHFGRPNAMYMKQAANLVGCVKAIVNSGVENGAVHLLMRNQQIHAQDVIDQLLYVINEYDPHHRIEYVIVLKDIYKYLHQNQMMLSDDHRSFLSNEEWFWNGNGFVTPRKIVIARCALDLQPHMYSLLQDMDEDYIQGLLLCYGANPKCNKELLKNVLYDVKCLHENKGRSPNEEAVRRDLKICQNILQVLGTKGLAEAELEEVFVPVRCKEGNLKLVNSNQAVYSAGGGFTVDDEEEEMGEDLQGLFFLHECITEETAIALQIRSLTNKLIGAEDLGLFEEYGQSEPLTRRINRILEDYGDGFAIVKELIQNADDAGATEVKLLYDERRNKDMQKYLIDPGMKGFQGPALWAYNDAKFSQEDFDNIVKLSGATKENKRDKIGKFGLGFNAVYNITDVPSFISDNQLVILDPHTTNLGSAIKNKSKPGIKIPLGPKRSRLGRYVDQIRIYDGIFGMDASLDDDYKKFDGTLFRFPLRTEMQAQKSEIKNLFYSKNEMKELLKMFASEANRLLMFNQNVRKVEFYHLRENASSIHMREPLLKVSKKIYQPDHKEAHLRATAVEAFDIMTKSSMVVESQAKGFKKLGEEFVNFRNVIDIETKVFPTAMKELGIDGNSTKKTWLMHSCIDDEDCMEMAVVNKQLNPMASVAIAIEGQGKLVNVLTDTKGYFYCFLPLPMPNGLKVHVNSNFALKRDRKGFQETSEDNKKHDTLETNWNKLLMSRPVSSAYVGVLKDLTLFLSAADEKEWYRLWPVLQNTRKTNASSYNQHLITSFYSQVINKRENVFLKPHSKRIWLNWSNIRIIDKDIQDPTVREMIEEVFLLFSESQTIVHIPKELITAMKGAGLKEEVERVILSFTEFFTEVFMPNLEHPSLKNNVRDAILIHALRQSISNTEVSSSIKAIKCIPTQPFGVLKKPSELVKPKSRAADLFAINEQVFPSKEFNECYDSLVRLGMVADVITKDLLISRAMTVKELGKTSFTEAVARTKKILRLIDKKIRDGEHVGKTDEWHYIEFLPVKQKPTYWEYLDWEGEKYRNHLSSPINVYPSRFGHEVGCHKLLIDDAAIGNIRPETESLLGIKTTTTVSDICQQVELIYESISNNPQNECPVELHNIFGVIYESLARKITENSGDVCIGQTFKGKAIILTEDNTLVYSNQVAFDHSYDAKPYLYKLNQEFSVFRFKDLMKTLGVKQHFHLEDYHRALESLNKDANDRPLKSAELRTVRDLLESIKATSETIPEEISLPDQKGVLGPKDKVIVNDTIWMPKDPMKRYLHSSIPPELAVALGAKTARSHSISSKSRGLPFGQHEKLTVRLKRILEAYPAEIQILYELLQNADDAGATEVKFVLDKRTHPTEKVFGAAWEDLQGPALLVYNDAPFTQQDIEGIQRLGEGSKTDDSNKTGQYGIGFNVVYHVTDVPSLLTTVDNDSVLCIFDPHARFLEECSQAEPGRMFEDARNYLKYTFNDIYNTFLPTFFTNEKSATLRLPLRTQCHASVSDIKGKETTLNDMLKIFESFKKKGPEAIIFLRNVRSIELYIFEETAKEPECIFSIQASMSNKGRIAASMLNEDCMELVPSVKNRCESNRNFRPVTYELRLSCDGTHSANWKVIQKCASVSSQEISKRINDKYSKKELPLIPFGGISCKIEEGPIDGKVYCLLPLAVKSSLPIHINGKFILDYESRRRLWYSHGDSFQKDWNCYIIENCVLPCYIELMKDIAPKSNVRGETEKILIDAFNAEEKRHPPKIDAYFSHFPTLNQEEVHEYDSVIIKMFYMKLAKEEVPVMPVLKPSSSKLKIEFCPPNTSTNQFYVPDITEKEVHSKPSLMTLLSRYESTKEKKHVVHPSSYICISLIKLGMNIYNIPKNIVQGFHDSGVPLQKLTPAIVVEFLRANASEVLKHKNSIKLQDSVFKSSKTVKELLRYCMKDENFALSGLPLLVTEDDVLRVYDDSKHVYYGEISTLFSKKTYLSLHPDLRPILQNYKNESHGPLRQFMLNDFEELLERELPDFKDREEIEVTDGLVLKNLPSQNWLVHAWRFLRERFKEKKQHDEEARLTPKSFLNPVSQWCLFPVERYVGGVEAPRKYFLIKINTASIAINPMGSIYAVVMQLGLPVPSSKLVEHKENSAVPSYLMPERQHLNTDFLMSMVTSVEDLNALIDALYVEHKRVPSGFSRLSPENAVELLKHMQSKIRGIDHNHRGKLKELPIWLDLSGKLNSIASRNHIYLIKCNVPQDGIAPLQERYNVMLLENQSLPQLYRSIEIADADVSKVYCELILTYFDELGPDERRSHLTFLQKYLSDETQLNKEQLLDKLKRTRIIEKEGKLSLAKDFYNPFVRLFKIMLEDADFPPSDYSSIYWLIFLRNIGLVSTVTPELFLKFANSICKIEEIQKRRQKSKGLVHHLLESDELKEDQVFLDQLSTSYFLVADELRKDVTEVVPVDTQKGLICFKNSVRHTQRNILLCWTVEKILPDYADRFDFLPYKQLNVRSGVPIDSVASNLANVSKSRLLDTVVKGVKAIKDHKHMFHQIFKTAYEFLSQSGSSINEDAKSLLSSIPIVMVSGDTIVIANKVTGEGDFNFPPYLFSMPRELWPFAELFKQLGMTLKPTVDQLIRVLQGIYFRTDGQPLGPNEYCDVLKVIQEMISLLEKDDFPADVILVPLPGAREDGNPCCLHKSEDLVYFDDKHFERRLGKFQLPRLHLEHDRVNETSFNNGFSVPAVSNFIRKIPSELKPRILSDLVEEEMLDSETLSNQGFTKQLEVKLTCAEFVSCFIRLLKHQQDRHEQVDPSTISNIQDMMLSIQVVTKERVETFLRYDGSKVDGSEAEKQIFIRKDENTLVLLIQASIEREAVLLGTIASAIVSHFGAYFTDPILACFVQTLLQIEPESMHGYLDSQDIRRDDELLLNLGKHFYRPGAFVHIFLHCLLINDVSMFKVDDYVAYEVEDPGLEGKDGEPVFIYAIIREHITEGDCEGFYKVDIGCEELKTIHMSELYGFCRPENLAGDEESELDSIDEVKQKITQELHEAFRLGEDYGKKIIKRLWLKWHPDKNVGREEFCTEVFNFIQNEIERLRGNKIKADIDGFWSQDSFTRYSQRGRDYYGHRRKFENTGFCWRNGFWRSPPDTKNPQPREAERWFRQAEYDLNAAASDLEGCNFEWTCFKCHQAAEKSLKAAVYMQGSEKANHHFLQTIAADTGNESLERLASYLESILTGSAALRYPDRWCYPSIPHDMYDSNKAHEALRIAKEILEEVKSIIQ